MGGAGRCMGLALAAGGLLGWAAALLAPAEAAEEERLAVLEAEGEDMEGALEELEMRLLANQASIHLWQELERRHRQVSTLHCRNVDSHLIAMARHLAAQEDKARQLRRRRRVLALDSVLLNQAHDSPRHSKGSGARPKAVSSGSERAAKRSGDVAAESG
jgi:hypothetical protein